MGWGTGVRERGGKEGTRGIERDMERGIDGGERVRDRDK